MYGIAPINGRIINDSNRRRLEDLISRSFLSQSAFSKNPLPKKVTQVRKRGIICWVSLTAKPTPIGSRVSKPAF